MFNDRISRFLLVAFLVLLSATQVVAASLGDYERNLQQSISSLQELVSKDEAEDIDSYRRRLTNAVAQVRISLPANQSVQFGEENCSVDNTWLHQQLNELEKNSSEDPEPRLTSVIERLTALLEEIKELSSPGKSAASKEESKERLATILKRPEFASQGRKQSAILRLLRNLSEWIRSLFPNFAPIKPGNVGLIGLIARILVVIIALALTAYVVSLLISRFKLPRKKAIKKKKEPRIVLGERLEPETSSIDLLSQADALARTGDLRAAIRKAYIALLIELGDRKIVSLAQHKTNRDYLKSVRNLPSLHTRMIGLTDSFERNWYGFGEPTTHDWQSFREGYKAALESNG